MTELLFCKDICPLVAGNADEVEHVSTGSLRRKNIHQDGSVIGYVSVLVKPQFIETTGKDGIHVPPSAQVCLDIKERMRFVLQKNKGAMGGGLECKFTNDTEYGSGVSNAAKTKII